MLRARTVSLVLLGTASGNVFYGQANVRAETRRIIKEIKSPLSGMLGRDKRGMQELVKLGKPAVPYLIDSVTDDAGNVRMMIAWALDRIDAEESARTLLQRSAAAGRDRWRYIEAIRFMSNGSEHVKSDLEGLLSDSDLAVRVQAASALIQTSYKPISRSPVTGITTYSFEPSEAILPVLLEGLDSQRDEIKMWSAEGVYSLGKSRGAPAIPKLEQIVATEDPDSPLFRSAKLSLDMLKEGGAVP